MTNDECRMTNGRDRPTAGETQVAFDLESRTTRFSESAIDLGLRLPNTPVLAPLITQFVKSSTSIGANYCEADDAESKSDFRHKIALCRKEARETKYWCRLLASAAPTERPALKSLWIEARELHLIFCKIIRSTDSALRAARPPPRPPNNPARN